MHNRVKMFIKPIFCKTLENVKLNKLTCKPYKDIFKNTQFCTDTFRAKYSAEEIQEAVREYQKSSYINNYLRDGSPLSEQAQKLYDTLSYAIKTSKPLEQELVTYRGVNLNPRKNLDIDTILDNKGFTSVTEDLRFAKSFIDNRYGALIKITFPKKFKILKAPSEYITAPGTRFEKAVFNPTENLWETRAILEP